METAADVAIRCGIPLDKLEDLIELPKIAQTLVYARDNPDVAPEAIFAMNDLPMCDPDGLDFAKLELELDAQRRIATNTRGDFIEMRLAHPIVQGRFERMQKIANRRMDVINRTLDDLRENNYERAKAKLAAEQDRSVEEAQG